MEKIRIKKITLEVYESVKKLRKFAKTKNIFNSFI